MFKTLITVSTLTILAGGSLLLAGCASDKSAQPTNQPYGLTGSSDQNPAQFPKVQACQKAFEVGLFALAKSLKLQGRNMDWSRAGN